LIVRVLLLGSSLVDNLFDRYGHFVFVQAHHLIFDLHKYWRFGGSVQHFFDDNPAAFAGSGFARYRGLLEDTNPATGRIVGLPSI
jgi:hypothetical protein